MFTTTRLKLTGWYLLIIMVISTIFSIGIYRLLTVEIERGLRMQRYRMEFPGRLPSSRLFPFRGVDPELLIEIKERIIWRLVGINALIFFVTALSGYVLAGRTLKPIEEMVEDQKRFIADASHELRTPLTSMKTENEVALRDKLLTIKDAKKLLASNLEEVDKIQRLSNYLLTLSRYQNTASDLTFEKIRISQVLKHAVDKVSVLAKKKKISIQKEIEDIEIEANSVSLTELVNILLDNAIKYSNEYGTIYLRTKVRKTSVNIQVEDYGIGIDPDDLSSIFNRFYRADSARSKTSTDGYGLGLAIARSIVDLHNGKITVESTLHKGSVFTVSLPGKHTGSTI